MLLDATPNAYVYYDGKHSASINESNPAFDYSDGRVSFSISSSVSSATTINFTTSGTAVLGTDYILDPSVVTIPSGQTVLIVYVHPIYNPSAVAGTEFATITLQPGSGYAVTSTSYTATVPIDIFTPPPPPPPLSPRVTISSTGNATEGGQNGGYQLARSGGDTTLPLTVNLSTSATGGAALGVDYTLTNASSTVTFGANQTTVPIVLRAVDNVTVDPARTVTLTVLSGTGYTVGSPNSATDQLIDNDPQTSKPQATNNPCKQGPQPTNGPDTPVLPGVVFQLSGVNLATGSSGTDPSDFNSSGFGRYWGQDIGWTSIGGYSGGGTTGTGLVNNSQPAMIPTADGGYMVVSSSDNVLWFTPNGSGGYTAKFFGQDLLSADGTAGDFKLVDTLGNVTRYYGFQTSLPVAQRGKFKSITDASGNAITTTYNAAGQVTASSRTDGTTTETFAYTYLGSGINQGMAAAVALLRTVGSSTTTIRQVTYAYYDGFESYGNAGNLKLEQVKDGAGNVLDTTYYRYYTPADIGTTGYVGGLKYVFHPDSYARLAAAVSAPTAGTDAQVAPYADAYYEYDGSQRVAKAITQGTGCSCAGSTGQGTFTYSYTNSTNVDGYNNWQTKTVETLPDGTQNIVYANFAGEVVLRAFNDASDSGNSTLSGKLWATAYRYDSQGRLILTAQPSAVTIQSLATLNSAASSYADIVGYNASAGTYQYLSANSGVINLIDYGTSTTATASTAGDVLGYFQDEKVQNGYAGSAVLLDSVNYFSHTDTNSLTIYVDASSSVYRNTNGTGAETTSYTYTWFTGTNQVQSISQSAPVVSSAQNGPGTADVSTSVYDAYGRMIWTKDPDGFINYYAYDNATGAVVKTIVDVDTTQTSQFTSLPSGWSTPSGGGLNLITLDQVDGLGRTVKETSPAGNITYVVYNDPNHEIRTYPSWNSTTNTPTGPTHVYRLDRPGSYAETLTMSAAPHLTGGIPDGTEAVTNIQSLSRTYTDTSGRTIERDDYFSLAGLVYSTAGHIGVLGTNYYATSYGYDDRGRLAHTVNAVGTITNTIYDALGRPYGIYVGTNDSGFWPGTSGSGSNMTLVEQDQYDSNGVGDGNLTQVTLFPNATASDNRVTQYAYDWRDRLVATKSGVKATEDTTTHRPIIYYELDNLGEITTVSQFDGDAVTLTNSKPSASLLRAYAVLSYDDQGRVYRTSQYSVNQSTGAVSTYALSTNRFYDHRGNVLAESAPGGQVTRYRFDGAGRFAGSSISDGPGGVTWSGAGTLFAVHAITQTQITYDGDGNVILVTRKDRFDNDTDSDTGGLGSPTSSTNKARISYEAYYYDAADRQVAYVNVGTNGGATYTRPSSVPARSDTVLVTSTAYNAAGWVQDEVDPRGVATHITYDPLGRPTQVINAYNASVNGGLPTSSANQTTNYAYNGIDKVTDVTVVMPSGTPNQTTHYEYHATTSTSSNINSNDFLTQIWQPDPVTGVASTAYNQETWYTYNAAGDVTILTDPNRTAHTYTYDLLGRQTGDAVTTLASGVDGSILRHTTAYDTGGRPYLFTSYDAASGGSIVNQVQDGYNGLGQLTTEYQEHSGAVNTSTSPKVQYAYTEMASGQNNSRLTRMTYPNGRAIDYVYNSGIDTAISRVSSIADDVSGTPGTILESYSYLGLGTIVQKAHPESGVNLTYIQQTGDSQANTTGGDRYTGLDRFGRVIDQNWLNTNTGTAANRYQYGYDRNGNVLYRADLVNTALSELYHANSSSSGDNNTAYDALGRLTSFSRGTLSSSGNNGTGLDRITTSTRSQSWQLDALGNWGSLTDSGTTTTRGFNAQNQATSVTGGTAPTFDQNGNTLTNFNPLTSAGQQNVYDAWNRLVAVKNAGGTTQASYTYDALGRRIVESYPGTSTTTHLYHSALDQVIEERLNGTAASNVSSQYVWSQDYVNALVLRDIYSGGVRTQRLYALQDANYNTTALVDTTGAVQERYVYDPYGTVTILDASATPRTGNLSSYAWRYLFQGGRRDVATGWYQFQNRDLIPSEGRWAERDPLGLGAGDLSQYRFVGSNPVGAVDPTGLQQRSDLADDRRALTAKRQAEGFSAGDWLDRNFGGGQYGPPGRSGQAIAVASEVSSIVPLVGDIKDGGEAIGGRDSNGYHLTPIERSLTALAAFVPILSGSLLRKARKLGKAGDAAGDVCEAAADLKTPRNVIIDGSKHPESARHAQDAIDAGVSPTGIVDRAGAKPRRAERLKDEPRVSEMDRDEFPPAVLDNGSGKHSIRPVPSSDNRGAGSSIRHQLSGVPDKTPVTITPINVPPKKPQKP